MTKIAVVGMGYWGPNLVRNFVSNSACADVVAWDRCVERLRRVQRWFGGRVVCAESWEGILRSDVDGVVLATPVSTHYALARQALESGKHVLVEKPLATSEREAEVLVQLAERSGRTLMVGHTFEYSPPVRRIRDIIGSGELGRLFFTSSMRVNLGLHQPDTSVIWDLAPHDFSILFFWLGEEPLRVATTGRAFVQAGVPDVAFITLTFPSGTIAQVEVSWLAPSKLRRTAVVGDKKMLVYDDTETNEKVKIYDRGVHLRDPENFGEYQLSYRTGDILIPHIEQGEPLGLETDDFLQAIRTGRRPQADGLSGQRVVRALAAAERSLAAGGHPVALA